MDPDTGAVMSGDLLEEIMTAQPTPVDLVLVALVNVGILLLPMLVLATAVLKLRRFPEHRTLHWGLALSAGLAVALSAAILLAPGVLPEEWRQSGIVSFTWVFLFAWMALDFTRSARHTGLRPRLTDIAVLLCAATVALAFLSPFLMY
jgi:hypothetical membrane protein